VVGGRRRGRHRPCCGGLNNLPPAMTKAELESKSLAELHELAAKAGVQRYRMLSRGELVEKLSGEGGEPRQAREPRQRQSRGGRERQRRERAPRGGEDRRRSSGGEEPRKAPAPEPAASEPAAPTGDSSSEKPKRRRRRRFGRRGRKSVRVQDLLLPAAPGRQALVYAETKAGCTALLRELAAELSGGKGPDPVALLVDPSPEELAEWKREAPKAEIVSAGQERHAEDALAQAVRRAEGGEAVVFLVDSLSRAAEEFSAKLAKDLFDAGQSVGAGSGSLTVVAALERPA
jgi:transcription termination factor Rho